jgi:hypothetical protein
MADPITAATLAVNAATPFVSRALGSAFGVKSAEEEERQRILDAMAPYMRVAEGGTTQGQAGLAYARGRAISDLESQAARGTAQQQAGMRREAMRQGADVQARYASQLAELRAVEQERARRGVAAGQMALADVAGREAQRKRDELAGFAEGVLGLAGRTLIPGEGGKKKTGGRVRMGGSQTNAPGQSLAASDAGAAAGVVNMPETVIASERQAPGVVTMPETVIGGPSVRDVGETRGPVQSLAQVQAPIQAAGQSLAAQYAATPSFVPTPNLAGPRPFVETRPEGTLTGMTTLGAAQGPHMTPSPIAMTRTMPAMAGLSDEGSAMREIFNRRGSVPKAPMPVMPTRRKAVTAPKARKARRIDFEID